jgi:hypothetical protein
LRARCARLAAASVLILLTVRQAPAQFQIRQIPERWTGPAWPASAAPTSGDAPSGGTSAEAARPMVGALPAQPPHPAVARITVPEKESVSMGSGTLIDARGKFGLVITNWHVVRDATGPITVEFPEGHRSPAEVVRTDKDWDLAALSILRPKAEPVPISPVAPQLGEWLAIAGYGSGEYRTAAGVVQAYNSPSVDLPQEFIELSAEARHGDSGGPILNQHGQLCGVLFGSAPGYTCGAYGGRVRQFLATVIPGGEPGSDTAAVATIGTPQSAPPVASAAPSHPWMARAEMGPPRNDIPPAQPQTAALHHPPPPAPYAAPPVDAINPGLLTPATSAASPAASPVSLDPKVAVDRPVAVAEEDGVTRPTRVHAPVPLRTGATVGTAMNMTDAPADQVLVAVWRRFGGTTLYDQSRSVLAILGVLAVATQVWRFSNRRESENP